MASIGVSGSEPMVEHQTEFSGWWRRVGATLIDGLILMVPILIVALVAGTEPAAVGIIVLVSLLVALVYGPFLMAREGANNGQTFGKQALGIRVVHESGEPMTFGRGVIRDFVGKSVLGMVPFYGLIDSLFPLWDGRKQAIHDKVGSTTVHLAE